MPRRVKMPLLGAVACLVALVPVAVAAYKIGPFVRLDRSILFGLVQTEGGTIESAAELIRFVGELPVVIVLLAGIVLLGRHLGRRREALAAFGVVLGAAISGQLLKLVFAYPRFEDAYWTHPQELAFPSGHTTAAASLSIALVLVVPPARRLAAAAIGIVVTAAVGISVVVLGWHYPSDVLGGLLVASAWGLAAVAWLRFRADRDGVASETARPRPRQVFVSPE